MDWKILINFALLATFGCPTEGNLIVKPRDTDVKVNQSTYFNCSTDHQSTAIFWYHGGNLVYAGTGILDLYKQRFHIDRIVENGTYIYNLLIHSVQPGDAGIYICADDEGVGDKYPVQLVVLEDGPICRSNRELNEVIGQNTCSIEPDEVELECSVTYHGNIPPRLEWRKSGGNSSTPLKEVSVVTSRNHFLLTLKIRGDIALNNSFYVCETNRTTLEPIKCTTKVIKILYAVGGNSTVNLTINEEVHCSAYTSELCSYEWKWWQDSDFTVESSTALLKSRKQGWHRCEAQCYLRNNTCNLNVMRAFMHGETKSSQATLTSPVVLTVVLGGLLIAGCVLIFVVVRSRQRKTAHRRESGMTMALSTRRGGTLIRPVLENDGEGCEMDELLCEPLPDIYGLAILETEMFISRRRHPYIEVYNAKTFQFVSQVRVNGMINPEHIVSCSVNKCLYAFDWEYHGKTSAVLRINPNEGNLITTWNINGSGGRLSVASDTNVILNKNHEAMLHEYTADGELIRKIALGAGTEIFRSWQAVKLHSGQLVVCHVDGDYDNPLRRVCLLSTKATADTPGRTDEVEVMKEFGRVDEELISKLWRPLSLSVDKENSVLVLDGSSNRAVLLSSNLDKPRIIVSEVPGMKILRTTCFDASTGRWFVADNFRVMVCQVKDEEVLQKLRSLINY